MCRSSALQIRNLHSSLFPVESGSVMEKIDVEAYIGSLQTDVAQQRASLGGGSLQLLLYAVFRIGGATNNISYASYEKWKSHPAVSWTIPYSLGDSHRGFRVLGQINIETIFQGRPQSFTGGLLVVHNE